MTYETDLAALAEQTTAKILELMTWDRPPAELAELVARSLAAADDQARALAWQHFASLQVEAVGTAPTLTAAVSHANTDRLTAGAARILALDDPAGKLSQAVHRLTSWHAADETRRQIRRSTARGWKRGLESAACQMCKWWERDGRLWPDSHPMPRHTGCRCQQIPIWTRERVAPVPYARKNR